MERSGCPRMAVGMVFQEPRLLPWRTTEQNIRLAAPEATDAGLHTSSRRWLKRSRDHYPGELSLGWRVASRSRAPSRSSPISWSSTNLSCRSNAALAAHLRDELAALVARRPVTTLLVTHNVEEAIGLADRLFFLSAGPARVVAEVRSARPRAAHTPEEIARSVANRA